MEKKIKEAINIAKNGIKEKFYKYNKMYLFTTENLCYVNDPPLNLLCKLETGASFP